MKPKLIISFSIFFLLFFLQLNVNAQILVGSDSISTVWPNMTYFDFSAQSSSNDSTGTNFLADFRGTSNEGLNFGAENTLIPGRRYLRYAASGNIDTVTMVPEWTNSAPWVNVSWDWPDGTSGAPVSVGELWVVYTREGHYAVMQITYTDSNSSGQIGYGDYFKFVYKYQQNGSTNLTGAIPVELSSFTASIIGNNIKLFWTTATETNNMGFEIQRSVIDINQPVWDKVGFVQGNGTTTEMNDYSFVDKSVSTGIYNYRLKQIDFDGTFEYSNIIEVDLTVPSEFVLYQNYPNPFNPSTNINFQLAEKSFVTLKVYDMLGKEVAVLVNETRDAGNHIINFDASQFSSGLYLYTITAGNFSSSKKMLLMK